MNIPYGQKRYIYLNPYFSNVPILTIKMFVLMCPYVCTYLSMYIYSFSPVTIRDGAEEIKTNRCLYLVSLCVFDLFVGLELLNSH